MVRQLTGETGGGKGRCVGSLLVTLGQLWVTYDQARPGPGHGDKTSPLNETTDRTNSTFNIVLTVMFTLHTLTLAQIITKICCCLCSLPVTPQTSRISYAYVSITKSIGSNQLSTQQFGLGRIYSTQHFLVELVWTFLGFLFPIFPVRRTKGSHGRPSYSIMKL